MILVRKKFLVIVSLIAIIFVLTVGMTQVVNAGNYSDTKFAFKTRGDGSDYSAGPMRAKMDYTSSYVYNYGSDCDFAVTIYAGYYKNGKAYNTYPTSYSIKPFQRIRKGEWSYLPNLVKESGYNYCQLAITPAYHESCWISGFWSPDSI